MENNTLASQFSVDLGQDTRTNLGPFEATVSVINTYLHFNECAPETLPGLIWQVHDALSSMRGGPRMGEPLMQEPVRTNLRLPVQPAVPIDQSVARDHIICLEDGKPVRLLKRYLKNVFNMTPDEYRSRWGLPANYPMVAPALSEHRAQIATQTRPHLKRARNIPEAAL